MKHYVRFLSLALFLIFAIAQPALAAVTVTGTYKATVKFLTTATQCANQAVTLKITYKCSTLIKGKVVTDGKTIQLLGTFQNNYVYMNGVSDDMNTYVYLSGIVNPSSGDLEGGSYSQDTMNEIDRVYSQPITFIKQ